jgi:hypothetical protein
VNNALQTQRNASWHHLFGQDARQLAVPQVSPISKIFRRAPAPLGASGGQQRLPR